MKKIIALLVLFLPLVRLHAQNGDTREVYINPEMLRIVASIFVLLAFMIFILAILKRMLDYRLKNKIVDKGIPENLVASILQTNPGESRHLSMKWFALLAAAGIGFTVIYYTLPLGIHSLAIIAFSIALGFLGYFFYLRQTKQ